jgi:hypothetical protein
MEERKLKLPDNSDTTLVVLEQDTKNHVLDSLKDLSMGERIKLIRAEIGDKVAEIGLGYASDITCQPYGIVVTLSGYESLNSDMHEDLVLANDEYIEHTEANMALINKLLADAFPSYEMQEIKILPNRKEKPIIREYKIFIKNYDDLSEQPKQT